ncbi:MAG: class I SAM-dependent DNA methyltransferase [Ruminococcus sp.]|nr:class I SAM-dependent DNA methyltransferase [Ruminococcus sp.]
MSEQEKKRAAKEFAAFWKDKGYEKGESQKFWMELLGTVYGVDNPSHFIEFEDQVHLDHTSFIDGYIPETKVLIEQKGLGKDLRKPIKQSDGTRLTPFQQAKRYSAELPYSKKPRWIVTCNFSEFLVYDMENPNAEPEQILLKDLPKEHYRLNFLTDVKSEHIKREMEVSIKAGELVGKIYDALRKQYREPDSPESLKSLNILCVRLVFCLYAEDADVFNRLLFYNYLDSFKPNHLRAALLDLFKVLNTPEDKRDPYLDEELAAFPYVNGGLFAEEDIEIPQFTEEIKQLLMKDASADFDWSEISPTIFGAVFESTLNPETRRKGGMHYTSIENIHKVIDPLFLNDLRDELEEIKLLKQNNVKKDKLDKYREKLASLKFLDPACGSGNFLTETYISLRMLENEAIKEVNQTQMVLGAFDPIKVKIDQFYGIEINDFAVTVAKAALWIAESQMMKKTEDILHMRLDFLPLTTNAYIVEGNALRLDWNEVVDKSELNYIMGNPPFVGYYLQSKEQKDDILQIYKDEKGKSYKTAGKNDYVSGWYFKASNYICETHISCAFVSTNSITQGEQAASVWQPLYERFNVIINFAYRTFRWDSESNIKAHVHCVIVGFSIGYKPREKILYDNGKEKIVNNINPFLVDAPTIFIESRKNPISKVPKIMKGNIPVDDGNLLLSDEEYRNLIAKRPDATSLIKRFLGAKEFLHNKKRWCLWLLKVSPQRIKSIPEVYQRVLNVKEFREKSAKAATRKYANYPTRFMEIRQPESSYLIIPSHSSEKRRYIPIGYESSDTICGNANLLVPNAELYHFGVLTSNVHMAWMRAVAGRLEMRYRYSNDIVYNNFPWCNPTPEQKAKIEKTAQAILDARALYPDSSLADLYDELTMPPELRKAHQENDRAVMQAYGFSTKMTESECVAELMKMYSKLTKNK